jgi:dTMP kinase
MMKEGLFITFEGIDGCGKTTQITKAEQYLLQKGISCFVTREPGGTKIGEKIRDLILSTENREMKNSCELLLYLAARAQHVEEKILPALMKGVTVLCDRYQEATFAYQGFGRGYPLDILQRLNKFASSDLTPRMTFIFDISVACAFERIKKSGKKPDRLEKSSMDFYQRIREGYLALASSHPKRIILLQGDKPVDEIFSAVKKELDTLFSLSA